MLGGFVITNEIRFILPFLGFLRWMAEKNEKLLVIRFCSFVFYFYFIFVFFSLQADFVVLYLGFEEVNKYQNEKSMR
jgi:hypothetical protein